MPKLKTRKGARKRLRISKRGKIKHFKSGKGHLLTGKSSKRRRNLRRPAILSSTDVAAMRNLLPYGA